MIFARKKPRSPAIRVLFVCMGNICRSPMAEGILRQRLADREMPMPVEIDSAGTHGYHIGDPPDDRAQSASLRRGVDISALRARRVRPEDFAEFDLVIAMDEDNLEQLYEISAEEQRSKIRLLLEFSPARADRNVPDPYYGGQLGFERVLDLVEDAVDGLLDELLRLAADRLASQTGEPDMRA